jgi:hypothetical protein
MLLFTLDLALGHPRTVPSPLPTIRGKVCLFALTRLLADIVLVLLLFYPFVAGWSTGTEPTFVKKYTAETLKQPGGRKRRWLYHLQK